MELFQEKHTHLHVPLAILIAGIMVSGSILYVGGGGSLTALLPAGGSGSGNEAKAIDINEIASDLKLDEGAFKQCLTDGTVDAKIDRDIAAGSKAGVSGTPSFLINGKLVVGALPFATFKQTIDAALATPTKWDTSLIADGVTKGSANAPVTMIEFSDFECPYCKRFFSETLPSIQKEYIDTGKVRLVYRHYPLTIHAHARSFAQASECANLQGKFWEYHDALFSTQ